MATAEGARVLVLGGTGFLGASLLAPLCARGYRVRVYSRRGRPDTGAVPGVEYLAGDIADRERLRRAVAGTAYVAHFADATLPQTAEADPQTDLLANLAAAWGLLTLCAEAGTRRLLYCSSGGTVYGVPRALPVPETAVPAPISSYGLIKHAVESAVRFFCARNGLEHVIFRPSNVYGPGQSPFRPQGLVAVAMLRALRGEPVAVYGDGSVVRDYLYIDDFAEFFLRCLEGAPTGVTVNVGSGEGRSVGDVLAGVGRALGRPVAIERRPARGFDVPANYLDIGLARALYGWTPRVRLEEGLRRTAEAFAARFGGEGQATE
ncbi:NAD-dependent epimerase/dehydratase family protein [Solidesulfovibrio alcoholivorans]|uniref:NAD-dependent epimerase/dehydratase family protein n=1 Tax=Solidesulfovibrio alcoholivorans TaxID=81406 RepID=UPI000B07C090|nr:NAD-dependent epimerase/dehydratase family protein [Solidesulfovibrio alcoholivorans]